MAGKGYQVMSLKSRVFFLLPLLLISVACHAQDQDIDTVRSEQENFRVVSIAKDLHHPWSLEFLPNGNYLISERRGRLWHVSPEGKKIEITGVPKVFNEGQGGLLDIVVEPNFKDGGWLYFSYAATADEDEDLANTEVARAKLNLKQNRLTDKEVIFRALPKVEGDNHWGSRLLFAPDGTLYITLGERFNYEDQAQDISNHMGSIVRIKPNGDIPKDNPFVDDPDAKNEIYSFGHRNVQGIALHPQSGKIWTHEHGPKGGDEINILKAGANYGWPKVTYGISYWGFEISDKTSAPGFEDPVIQWTPSIAPSGMAFYQSDKFPEWRGDLFVGALAKKHLRRLEIEGEKVIAQEVLLKDMEKRIRDVRTNDGFLYILTDESNGELLRLEPVPK